MATISPSSEDADTLGSVSIMNAPDPGKLIKLKSSELKKYLSRKGINLADINWKGPQTITIKRDSIVIGPANVRQILTDFIESKQDLWPQVEIRLKDLGTMRSFELPVGKLYTEVIPTDPSIIHSQRFNIVFRVNGKIEKNITVKAQLEALANIAIATDDLKRGSLIDSRDFHLTKVDIIKVRNPCFEPNELIGKKLKRSVRQGQPLDRTKVEFPPLIRRGEIVTIIAKKGALTVTASGTARHDAIKNAKVKVVNNNSQKEIIGTVTANGLVKVEL